MGPEQQLTFAQKVKIGFQAAGAFARNPKALVALVKYQRAEKKRQKLEKSQPKIATPEATAPEAAVTEG